MSQDLPSPAPAVHPDLARNDIPGWGVDADPLNDPTYPMRDRSRDDSPGRHWAPPPAQMSDVEVLQSVEHVRRPAVFGTSTPPRGLSGVIRRAAFGYSESQWTRWLLLMLADRVNVAEGVAADVARGKPPNLYHERGMEAVRRHDPQAYAAGVATTVAVLGAAAGIGYLLLRKRRRLEPYWDQDASLTREA